MRYALVYGGLAGAVAIGVMIATFALDLTNLHTLWFGYLVMLAALSMIFVAIKRYRDVECGGVIRFGRAFGLGVGIAGVAGLIYVTGWDFMADYTASTLEQMRADGAAPAAIQAKEAEMRQMAEMYGNPLFRLPMIFAEIFPVGLLVALVSAALLRNPRLLPATR
jgi:hypothetical protein